MPDAPRNKPSLNELRVTKLARSEPQQASASLAEHKEAVHRHECKPIAGKVDSKNTDQSCEGPSAAPCGDFFDHRRDTQIRVAYVPSLPSRLHIYVCMGKHN